MVEQGLKDALQWINLELYDDPNANIGLLIDRAAQQFHLTPLQTDFLYREFHREGSKPETD